MNWLKKLLAKLFGKKTDWDNLNVDVKVKEDEDRLRKLNGDF